MLIDWFTVVAQIANFLILVALMRRFLYGPLIQAIDSREARIAGQLADADRKSKEAELLAAKVQTQAEELENGRERMIDQARKDADRQRTDLIQAARDSVQAMEARWQADLDREEDVFLEEVRRTAAVEMLAVMRRALADLASADIDHAAIQAFVEKLRDMDLVQLRTVCGSGATVASASELAPDSRRMIEQAIESRMDRPLPVRFECAPELAWGLELRGDGRRIGWTPNQYLNSLEEKMRSVLEEHSGAGSPVAVA